MSLNNIKSIKTYFLITVSFKDKRKKDLSVVVESDLKPSLKQAEEIIDKETIYYYNIKDITPITVSGITKIFGKKDFPYAKI